MAKLIKPVTIDCSRANRFQMTVSKQGDVNSRFLLVSLADNGNPIEITDENTVTINCKRADGEIKTFSGVINDDGTVTVPLTAWLLEVNGHADCEIVVFNSVEQEKLSSTIFTLYVEPYITDGSEVAEDENYDVLLTLITQVDTAVNACNTATEAAQMAITVTEQAISDAEAAKEATETAIANAETATADADTATARANAAAEIIENIKASDIPYDSTVTEKTSIPDVQTALDVLILNNDLNKGSAKVIKSWEDVQKIVRAGLAPAVFSVGDQLISGFPDEDTPLTWDIIGIDVDTPADSQYQHSLTLQSHDAVIKLPFNCPEALFINRGEEDIPAGTFNFTIDETTYQFTLTNDIPVDGVLFIPLSSLSGAINSIHLYEDIFSDGEEAALEVTTVTVGSEGTALNSLGAVNTNKQRMYGGGQRYKESALRSYLITDDNYASEKTLGAFGRLVGTIAEVDSFLYSIDLELYNVLGEVIKSTVVPDIDGGGTDVLTDKVFLLSVTEVDGNGLSEEGITYPYYEGTGNVGRKKNFQGATTTWRLRTHNPSNAYYVRSVNTSGNISSNIARIEYGVAPACCIV